MLTKCQVQLSSVSMITSKAVKLSFQTCAEHFTFRRLLGLCSAITMLRFQQHSLVILNQRSMHIAAVVSYVRAGDGSPQGGEEAPLKNQYTFHGPDRHSLSAVKLNQSRLEESLKLDSRGSCAADGSKVGKL